MTKQELDKLKHEINIRKQNLDIVIDTFGYDSLEVFIIKSEISLLENLFPEQLKHSITEED